MEKAAEKVESDMEEMKTSYKERIKKQDQLIAKVFIIGIFFKKLQKNYSKKIYR